VSTANDRWIAAEVLRDEFIHDQNIQASIDDTVEAEENSQATVDLFSRFLAFAAAKIRHEEALPNTDCGPSLKASLAVLLEALSHFTACYLSDIDLHSLVAPFNVDTRKLVLSSFYNSYATLQKHNVPDIPIFPTPSLFSHARSGEASVFALFGGQGVNEVYFDELQSLFDIYRPCMETFIETTTRAVLQPLADAHQCTSYYSYGLDALSWLTGATPRPPTAYLASVPVSMPLIGLTQLIQFLIVAWVSGLSLAELRQSLTGTTGHSQGLVAAVCVASSSDDESYLENALKGLKWLFYAGLRGQQSFPVLSLEPSIVEDAIKSGEGAPSPMLSVVGLALDNLQPHVAGTNKHLPSNSQLQVSLHNGPKAFVVTGPPRALYGLVSSLRKIKAPSGLDQSKIPFSQRKPVFSMRFLVVGVPYHSNHLRGVTDKVVSEDLRNEELWTAEKLGIAVYNTEDGAFLLISFDLSFR